MCFDVERATFGAGKLTECTDNMVDTHKQSAGFQRRNKTQRVQVTWLTETQAERAGFRRGNLILMCLLISNVLGNDRTQS